MIIINIMLMIIPVSIGIDSMVYDEVIALLLDEHNNNILIAIMIFRFTAST